MTRALLMAAAVALLSACAVHAPDPVMEGSAGTRAAPIVGSDNPVDPLIETLEERTFRWFWDEYNPRSGLIAGRAPSRPFSNITAVGLGLTAYGIGVHRGYVTRAEAAQRTLGVLDALWAAPQGADSAGFAGYRGWFYHMLDLEEGTRFRATALSTIDTAMLMGGVLFAQSFFDRDDPTEARIRERADSLYRRVEWDWMWVRPPVISNGWFPESGFSPAAYERYSEATILYVLALGSPTHPVPDEAWDGWTAGYEWADFYGYEHINFSPLFGHQYPHIWIDFRGIQDAYMREKGIDYFENSRRAAYAQRAYAMENPGGWEAYGAELWGLTASSGPGTIIVEGEDTTRFHAYAARGASAVYVLDDGTLPPTAATSSIAFAPEIAIPAIHAFHDRFGEHLFGEYGFLDAVNPSVQRADAPLGDGRLVEGFGWVATDYLSTDQGPIVAMIENYRSELVWEHMKRNPYIVNGLCRAGFRGGWIEGRCQ